MVWRKFNARIKLSKPFINATLKSSRALYIEFRYILDSWQVVRYKFIQVSSSLEVTRGYTNT